MNSVTLDELAGELAEVIAHSVGDDWDTLEEKYRIAYGKDAETYLRWLAWRGVLNVEVES